MKTHIISIILSTTQLDGSYFLRVTVKEIQFLHLKEKRWLTIGAGYERNFSPGPGLSERLVSSSDLTEVK